MRLACSYNPQFYEGELSPYKKVELMELGFLAYKTVFGNNKQIAKKYDGISLSLHVSRSPITEKAENQDIFISEKIEQIKDDERIVSVGFHLCDDRRENIGKYGFSSHYTSSSIKEAHAIRFIKNVKNVTRKDVWMENANFYSSSPEEIVNNWRSFNHIIKCSKAKSIIDLSHLVIDCSNNNIDPSLLVGLIDWKSVAEVHLSGIVTGRDGTLHDGHSNPVSPKVWELLSKIRQLGLLEDNIYCNIEHSDGTWGSSPREYFNDFDILESIFSSDIHYRNKENNALQYAKGYLKTLISQEVTNLDKISSHFDLTNKDLLDAWLNHLQKEKFRLSLSRDDMDSEIKKDSIYFVDSFIQYIEELQQ